MFGMNENRDKNTSFSKMRVFDFNGKMMDFTKPRVMGILNVTPDSFYDGRTVRREDGKTVRLYEDKVKKMVEEGAYIIDIGAVSTRPGAEEVSIEEEKRRLFPVLDSVRKEFPGIIISVDTFRAEIARMAAGEGVDMINDISGGTFDPQMLQTVVELNIPYILMHIRGEPGNMQVNPFYNDVVKEVHSFLLGQAKKLEEKGHYKIILDPGFGFGKTVEHNFALLSSLDKLAGNGYPVLAGLSRKSMINRVLGTKPAEALNGTTVLNTVALQKGATILRVHDVKEAVEAVKLLERL
jgi:dihydropteroate synthase